MRKWIDILDEAPIADITVGGDQPSFTPAEFRQLESPKWQEKVVRAFSRTPHTFDVHFLAVADFVASSDEDNEKIGRFLKQYRAGVYDEALRVGDHEVVGQQGRITVVVIGNLSPLHRMPMNAWTLAHKIGHGFQDRSQQEPRDLRDVVSGTLHDIAGAIDGLTQPRHWRDYVKVEIENAGELWGIPHDLLTMNSARQGTVSDDSEIFPELVAQYLVRGGVKLNASFAAEEFGATPEAVRECEKKIDAAFARIFGFLERAGAVVLEL